MPRATMAVTVLVSLAMGTACSGGPEDGATTPPAVGAVRPTSAASPPGALSSTELMSEVTANLRKAKSVHVAARYPAEGKDDTELSINFKVTRSGKAVGVLRQGTDRVSIRRLGKVLYFKANRSFWSEGGAGPVSDAMAGRWVKQVQSRKDRDDGYFGMTDLESILDEAIDFADAEREAFSWSGDPGEPPLFLVPGINIDGQPTIGLADTKSGEETKESGILYVASTNPALPLQLKVGLGDAAYMKFRSWNEPVRVVAPKGAISLGS
jgi:hypothetical protein